MEFARFLIAGIINTIVGYSVFWLANQTFGLHIAIANSIGYAAALIVAYNMNRYFVFESRPLRTNGLALFMGVLVVAFGINQAVLLGIAFSTDLHPGIIQVFAMGSYTVAFFLLTKFIVLEPKKGLTTASEVTPARWSKSGHFHLHKKR